MSRTHAADRATGNAGSARTLAARGPVESAAVNPRGAQRGGGRRRDEFRRRRWPRAGRRVQTPTVLQIETIESGAAALGMILAHSRSYPDPQEIRTRCGVSRDGPKPDDLVRAARELALDATCEPMTPTAVAVLAPPAILSW